MATFARWTNLSETTFVLPPTDPQADYRVHIFTLQPGYAALHGLKVGVFGPCLDGEADDAQFESRAFIAGDGAPEDPATGSLNAGIARWLLDEGQAPDRYVISQGAALGRAGRLQVERVGNALWIGGACVTCIEGTVTL
jgi:predicted PhzF superfamily epimerase YddE/YHI9